MDLEITHNKENQEFHVYIDEVEAYLKYRKLGPTMLEYYETFVPVTYRKRGIATAIVEEAMRYAQANNYMVVPTCDFVEVYINNHREYAKMRVEAE